MPYVKADNKKIGERLKTLRKANNYSLDRVAEACGVAQYQTVSNWETGNSVPALDKILKLCDLYRCDIDYILGKIECKTHDLQFIHDETGLSEKAVALLGEIDYDGCIASFISGMIEHRDGTTVESLSVCSECIKEEFNSIQQKPDEGSKARSTLEKTLADHKACNKIFGYLFECQNNISRFIKDAYMTGGANNGEHPEN